MECDRCKGHIEADETTYTVQYKDAPCREEICGFCLDKDGEKISEFVELGYQLSVSIPDGDKKEHIPESGKVYHHGKVAVFIKPMVMAGKEERTCPMCKKIMEEGADIYRVTCDNELFPNVLMHVDCAGTDWWSVCDYFRKDYTWAMKMKEHYKCWLE